MDIFQACIDGDVDAVRNFLIHKTEIAWQDNDDSMTPIHCAVQNGHLEVVRAIIEHDPGLVNIGIEFDQTPLYDAITYGQVDIARLLLENNARISEHDFSLHVAVRNNCFESVCLLVEAGIDLDTLDGEGYAPLHRAAENGRLDIVNKLIEHGAYIDISLPSGTALNISVFFRNLELAKTLIRAGANINKVNEYGRTPLHESAYDGCIEIVRVLIAAGANIEARVACDWSSRGDLNTNETPLFSAVKNGKIGVVRELLDAGANVDHRDSKGNNCLWWAVSRNHLDILDLFDINHGINTEIGSLYGSDRKNINLPLLEYLLERQKKAGANLVEVLNDSETFDQYFDDAELEDRSGIDYGATQETLFVTACAKGRADVAGLLHRYGADPKIKVAGRSAFALILLQANNDFSDLHERLQSQPTGEAGEATDTNEVVEISSPEQIIAKYLPSLSLILSVDHSFNPFDSEQNLPFGCENSYDFMQQLKGQGLNILDPLLKEHVVLKEYVLSSEKEKKQAEEIKKLQGLVDKFTQERSVEVSSDEIVSHGAPKRSPSPGFAEGGPRKFQRIR